MIFPDDIKVVNYDFEKGYPTCYQLQDFHRKEIPP